MFLAWNSKWIVNSELSGSAVRELGLIGFNKRYTYFVHIF